MPNHTRSRKIVILLLVMIIVIAGYVYFPRNILNVAKLHKIESVAIEKVNITVFPQRVSPDDSNEEVLNISLTDRESIGKVLALFEKKVVRKNINRSSSQEKSVGMFITFHYFDSDKSEPRISTMDIVTSDMIRINSSGYIVYGDGLDEDVEQFIEEVLRTRDDR